MADAPLSPDQKIKLRLLKNAAEMNGIDPANTPLELLDSFDCATYDELVLKLQKTAKQLESRSKPDINVWAAMVMLGLGSDQTADNRESRRRLIKRETRVRDPAQLWVRGLRKLAQNFRKANGQAPARASVD